MADSTIPQTMSPEMWDRLVSSAGSHEDAMEWMTTRSKALDGRIPFEVQGRYGVGPVAEAIRLDLDPEGEPLPEEVAWRAEVKSTGELVEFVEPLDSRDRSVLLRGFSSAADAILTSTTPPPPMPLCPTCLAEGVNAEDVGPWEVVSTYERSEVTRIHSSTEVEHGGGPSEEWHTGTDYRCEDYGHSLDVTNEPAIVAMLTAIDQVNQ